MSMQYTVDQLVALLPPQHAHLMTGCIDPGGVAGDLPITGARALDLASANEMVFCKSSKPELVRALTKSNSRIIVTLDEVASLLDSEFVAQRILILSPRPRLLMALLLAPFVQPAPVSIQTDAIHPEATIDPSVIVGPGVVLGADVKIGPDCIIGANTVIDHATIGTNTWVGTNCSIGGDGFGYEVNRETSTVIKVPHFGRVIIGSDVEISSNVCIDRGSLRDTVLGDLVKIDNLVHVAHNCVIERGAYLIANAMIGGSTTVGENAWVAPSTSLINGMTMGRLSMTGLGTVAIRDIPENTLAIGVPAKPLRPRFPDDSELT